MDEYKIKLDRSVLKQLGSQLYGDTPSVIAELVANSYDADAKNVWITVDTSQNNIYVEDDGNAYADSPFRSISERALSFYSKILFRNGCTIRASQWEQVKGQTFAVP